MDASAQAVLDFWFGEPGTAIHGKVRAEWFRKSDPFDAEIRQRFGPLIEQALGGLLREWDAQAESALARVVLLDQFTRNAFRDTARAFAGDALALAASRSMVASGQDRALLSVQRSFVYLPFEHADDMAMQDESVRLFTKLATVDPGQANTLDYALRHRAIVARFGRFPHRNAVLGRTSTADEVAFLQEPGSSF